APAPRGPFPTAPARAESDPPVPVGDAVALDRVAAGGCAVRRALDLPGGRSSRLPRISRGCRRGSPAAAGLGDDAPAGEVRDGRPRTGPDAASGAAAAAGAARPARTAGAGRRAARARAGAGDAGLPREAARRGGR